MREAWSIRKMQAGDPSGLEALMDLYTPYVSAVVWNLLRGAMPPEDAERQEDRLLVMQAIESLPPRDREVFLRHYYYAQIVREVAEAPEGVALPDLDPDTDGYYQLFGMDVGEQISFVPEEGAYPYFGYNMDIDRLPDGDPADNVKEAVVRFFADGEGTRFNDGVSKLLTIRGLWVQSPGKEYTEIFKGEFSCDLGLYYESKIVPLDLPQADYVQYGEHIIPIPAR